MQSNRRQWMAGAAAAALGGTVPGSGWAAASDLDRLEAMVEGAEAIRAVKRLQHAMALYALAGRWNELAGLFTADASADLGVVKLSGRKAIGDYFTQAVGDGRQGSVAGRLYAPLALSPVVTLDEGGALVRGRWREVALMGEFGRSARWAGGIWENTYAREGGAWKIRSLGYGPRYAGPYEGGWRSTAASSKPVPFHYDPRRAGIPVPELTVPAKRGAGGLAGLEARIRRMEDEAAIQNLQHAYGYYLDRKMWDDLADLFADHGTMELGQEGVYAGKASIRKGLERFGAAGLHQNELNDHAQLQTVVTFAADGHAARGQGAELSMTGYNGKHAEWGLGLFDNVYAKGQDGTWAIISAHVYTRMGADYAKGWAKDPLPAPKPDPSFPPDLPPTVTYQAYPAAFSPALRLEGPPVRPAPGQATASSEELQRRLDAVIARDGAENVSNAYGYYIDEFQWDATADLFAADGAKELSYIGLFIGRERVRRSLKLRYGPGGRTSSNMTLHQKTQPVTHVAADGRSARTRSRLFQVNSQPDRPGSYIAGIYENQLVKEDGVWRIKFMDLDYTWTASYADGWGKVKGGEATQFAPRELPPAFKEFPPDQPLRGVTVAPYPGVAEMAFHYPNPVTGRPPPSLLA